MRKKFILGVTSLLLVATLMAMVPVKSFAATTTNTSTTSIGFSAGTMSISSVPVFNFATDNTIPTATTTYTATSVTGNLVLLDDRGSGAGWKLTAQLSAFSNGSYTGSDAIMPTAQLQLPSPTITAYNGNTATAPSTSAAANLTPSEASAHTIITAAVGQGNGGWQAAYTASGVKLVVNPDNVVSGQSTATITWTLYNAPT